MRSLGLWTVLLSGLSLGVSSKDNFAIPWDSKKPANKAQAQAAISLKSGRAATKDIPPIYIRGNQFFYSGNGTRFFIKGIAYQQTVNPDLLDQQRKEFLEVEAKQGEVAVADSSRPSKPQSLPSNYEDPLADENACFRDIPYLQELQVNVIRVYSINPALNHDACMNALAAASIYVMLDLGEPYTSINRKYPSWNTELFDRYKTVVDAMAKYNNLMGFFAGNEVTNDKTNTNASPFVKAAVRDIKAYIKRRNHREIPVGYSTNDDSETRAALANYFVCGEDETSVDFYGINMYEWCGYSSFFTSGYSERTVEFQNYTVPLFFSEFGCNAVRPRPFQEIEALFSPLMTDVWSGGIAYMYHEEENKYGVVKVDPKRNTVKKLDDFRYLRDAFKAAKPRITSVKEVPVTKLKKPGPQNRLSCPVKSESWKASATLPEMPHNFKCECLETSLECMVSPGKKQHDFTKLYGILCKDVDCSDITGNGETGEYGYYSDCDEKQKLSYILNLYYLKLDKDPRSCDFDGSAILNKSPPSRLDLGNISKNSETCANLLKAFSEDFTNGKKNGAPGGSYGPSSGGKHKSAGAKLLMNWNWLFLLAFIF